MLPATPMAGCQWSCGPTAARSSTKNKVVINSPETVKALEYAKALSDIHSGRASWNDSYNNKAFLAGELCLTSNGISIYSRPRTIRPRRKSPRTWTTRCGRSDRSASRPNCSSRFRSWLQVHQISECREGIYRLHAGQGKLREVASGAQGYLSPPLHAYDAARSGPPIPRSRRIREARSAPAGFAGIGTPGEKAATAIADFVVVDMFANYCPAPGCQDPDARPSGSRSGSIAKRTRAGRSLRSAQLTTRRDILPRASGKDGRR